MPPFAWNVPPPFNVPAVHVNNPAMVHVEPLPAASVPLFANAPGGVKLRPPATLKLPLFVASELIAAKTEFVPVRLTVALFVVMLARPLPPRVAFAVTFQMPPVNVPALNCVTEPLSCNVPEFTLSVPALLKPAATEKTPLEVLRVKVPLLLKVAPLVNDNAPLPLSAAV